MPHRGLVFHLSYFINGFLLNRCVQFSEKIHKKLLVPGLCVCNNGLKLNIFTSSLMPWHLQVNFWVIVLLNTIHSRTEKRKCAHTPIHADQKVLRSEEEEADQGSLSVVTAGPEQVPGSGGLSRVSDLCACSRQVPKSHLSQLVITLSFCVRLFGFSLKFCPLGLTGNRKQRK